MIIGYDFWADGVYYDSSVTDMIVSDNDGVAFDTCNTIHGVSEFTLKGGTFDESYIASNGDIQNTERPAWSSDTVLLAKFQENLIGGTLGIDGQSINKIIIKRRKRGEDLWQTLAVIDYSSDLKSYTIIDKFIANETTYEYCVAPVANALVGTNSIPQEAYISYDHAHIFDNTASYNLVYNLKIGTLSKNIGANTIETLSARYPYIIYGQSDYAQGNVECLLVSEESATGSVNIGEEAKLRDNIMEFLCNKQYKILKNYDGLYMLIQIIGSPTLTPLDDMIGIYTVSFEYVQVGDANDLSTLESMAFELNYSTSDVKMDNNEQTTNSELYTQQVGNR